MHLIPRTLRGFTLIELSIALVVLGLIVGGVLGGRDLIKAAEVRATITQVERFNQAVNTFYGRFGYLPGDIPAGPAAQFGLAARGLIAGEGDGNGVLQGISGGGLGSGIASDGGETLMFWSDLSYANGLNLDLIEGTFSAASSVATINATATTVQAYLPAAKLGGGNYFYVYSSNYDGVCVSPYCNVSSKYSTNYIGLSAVQGIAPATGGCDGCVNSIPGLTVKQAAAIDSKVDDGLPGSGNVLAQYNSGNLPGPIYGLQQAPNASTDSAGTCYNSLTTTYSLSQADGLNLNCALSFKMQAGD